jgi:nicotinate-nucleotide pyrophosphorylase (carboxylating)
MEKNKNSLPRLDWKRINILIDLAIEEDFGDAGDITTIAVTGQGIYCEAVIICKEDCVCAGLPIAEAVFKRVNPKLIFKQLVNDGDFCPSGSELAKIAGAAGSILSAERTALNFLQRLCGIATTAKKYADAVKKWKTKILDTRKTTPGWRNLEKYAVAVGGASNHRIGLYDKILIKDNHRALASLSTASPPDNGIVKAVANARKKFPNREIEVEADSLDDVKSALKAGTDSILLDNMSDKMMEKAVKIVNGQAKLEASGGVTLERLAKIAKTGVDFISCGALTHSVQAVDLSLEIRTSKKKSFKY